ncbi:penicillin-binding protein activator [Formicincola oecophyllae]|uniref:penicillin-binding protein activator n=1 Tax=Formicincola oecophyllae TaxID=2558361 RepID=UPI0019D13AE4|nr:penicillin-binding protein activator [Formicincola oecophyllae]
MMHCQSFDEAPVVPGRADRGHGVGTEAAPCQQHSLLPKGALQNKARKGLLRRGLASSCALMAAMAFLQGCSTLSGNKEAETGTVVPQPGQTTTAGTATGTAAGAGRPHVALVLPLGGPYKAISSRMKAAALLALPTKGTGAVLDIYDSAFPKNAAQKAIAHADRAVLGPLTGQATQSVSAGLQSSAVPELSFTSDAAEARPGTWVMGLTTEQQVNRLVQVAAAEGRHRFAAFLPDNAFGHALGDSLIKACQGASLTPPVVAYHSDSAESIADGMAELSAIAQRTAGASAGADPLGQAVANVTGEGAGAEANNAAPPFDALLLGDTGTSLNRVMAALKADQVSMPQVRIMGPALWAGISRHLADISGAIYTGLDLSHRAGYVRLYSNAYHQAPSPVTDFAYDSAALVGALLRTGRLNTQGLTQENGFTGVDGWFRLLPDGHVQRRLNVYEILPAGGARLMLPANAQPGQPVNTHRHSAKVDSPSTAVKASKKAAASSASSVSAHAAAPAAKAVQTASAAGTATAQTVESVPVAVAATPGLAALNKAQAAQAANAAATATKTQGAGAALKDDSRF